MELSIGSTLVPMSCGSDCRKLIAVDSACDSVLASTENPVGEMLWTAVARDSRTRDRVDHSLLTLAPETRTAMCKTAGQQAPVSRWHVRRSARMLVLRLKIKTKRR